MNPVRAQSSDSLYSLHDFLREFPDDEACLTWLWRTRFSPDGERARCPKCDRERVFKRYKTKQQRQSWTCTGCGHHIHPTAGTIFAKSSRPLTDWFYVMYLVSSSRCGIAAKQVERELGCNYKTAWRMLNKVRNALMDQSDNPPLSGTVEVDETYVGAKRKRGTPRGRPSAFHPTKTAVFGAVERGGRIAATVIPNAHSVTLRETIHRFVLPASMIFTDEYQPYRKIGREGYTHRRVNHSQRIYVTGDVHTNTIEGFFGHFKTDVRGTHHSVSRRWLQSYLNEWVWKWNHRDDDRAMFLNLLDNAANAG
jgi:transposase-like protein